MRLTEILGMSNKYSPEPSLDEFAQEPLCGRIEVNHHIGDKKQDQTNPRPVTANQIHIHKLSLSENGLDSRKTQVPYLDLSKNRLRAAKAPSTPRLDRRPSLLQQAPLNRCRLRSAKIHHGRPKPQIPAVMRIE
jgi:hypothetical protein